MKLQGFHLRERFTEGFTEDTLTRSNRKFNRWRKQEIIDLFDTIAPYLNNFIARAFTEEGVTISAGNQWNGYLHPFDMTNDYVLKYTEDADGYVEVEEHHKGEHSESARITTKALRNAFYYFSATYVYAKIITDATNDSNFSRLYKLYFIGNFFNPIFADSDWPTEMFTYTPIENEDVMLYKTPNGQSCSETDYNEIRTLTNLQGMFLKDDTCQKIKMSTLRRLMVLRSRHSLTRDGLDTEESKARAQRFIDAIDNM